MNYQAYVSEFLTLDMFHGPPYLRNILNRNIEQLSLSIKFPLNCQAPFFFNKGHSPVLHLGPPISQPNSFTTEPGLNGS